MTKRTLTVLLLLLLSFAAFSYAEEGAGEKTPAAPVFDCKDLGVSFLLPEGVKIDNDIPFNFVHEGVLFEGRLRVVPGDLNAFRELITDETIAAGWKPVGQLTFIYKTTEVIEYRFTKDGKDLYLYVYPYAQGGHRFFYIACTGENLADKKAKVIEPLISTVTVKDVLKDNPPKPHVVNLKDEGLSVTCPWYWRMRRTGGPLKLSFSVFYAMKYYNHIDVYYYPNRSGDPEKDARAWLAKVKKHEQFRLIGDSPRKISGLKGVELEYVHKPSPNAPEVRRDRILFLYRNKDLFRIEFHTLLNTWKGGLDDYIKFLETVKIEPREDEAPAGEEKKKEEKPADTGAKDKGGE